jgi:xanthine dehydrogenase accessory factor
MSIRRIIEAFDAWRKQERPLVLATVYETLGSTYSKAGHRILIAANGDYQGLVSGGCLEGDLAERAKAVAESGRPAAVTYDMRDDVDELWGLGIGCNGLIRVFLQPLLAARNHAPFAAIAELLVGTTAGASATVIASRRDDVPAGATLVQPAGSGAPHLHGIDHDGPVSALLAVGCRRAIEAGRAEYALDAHGIDVLYAPLFPVPRILVLGAGLDAVPVVDLAAGLGWHVTVADHRPSYLERGGFERADRVRPVDPAKLSDEMRLEQFDAILVMSHHLATDKTYLEQLVGASTRYLGVLGPPARRGRLLDALGPAGEALRARLRGPVGLDLGGDSPETIALSILAEMQAVFSAKERR